MKKLIVILCATAGCVLLSGCSKSKNAATQSGNSADSKTASDSSAIIASDAPAEMKIKWEAGKKYAMHVEFNQGTETKMSNQPQPMKQEVKLAQDVTYSALKELDNGGTQLELEFENETMDVMQGDRDVLSFDSAQSSASDTNNPLAPMLHAMVGARIQYVTDANGNVEKVDDADLMNRLAATGKSQAQTMFKQQLFSDDTLKRYGSFGDMMPNRMVNVGESWTVNRDIVSTIGTLTADMKYTFKNWEQHNDHKCAHIEYAGDISSKSVSAATMGAAIEVEDGKVSGDVWFDPELGMIVDFNSDQNMTLKVTTRQQTLTPKLTQKIRMSLVDVTP